MDNFNWTTPARAHEVIDGDTIEFLLDQGFYDYRRITLRLRGIDTAEIYGVEHGTEEYERGMMHASYVRNWLSSRAKDSDFPFLVVTHGETGKYGRWIGDVHGPSGDTLNDDLIREYPSVER